MMSVAVVANPSSGRGRSLAAADRMCQAIARGGLVPTRILLDSSAEDFAAACTGALALVVVGGDGTVRSMAGKLRGHSVPLAIVPTGTENLAAREFGFRCSPDTLVSRIKESRSRAVDVGVLRRSGMPDHVFVVMVAAGFDAEVVADLALRRRGPVGHLSYLGPLVRMAARWVPPQCKAWASDELGSFAPESSMEQPPPISCTGQVVIANSRQYAVRLDPARQANPSDGQLDAVFLQAAGWKDIARWAIRLSTGSNLGSGAVTARAPAWRLKFAAPAPMQADGDVVPGGLVTEAEVHLLPGALRMVDMRPGN